MTALPAKLQPPLLDARLKAIADSIPHMCDCAADIGADHGRLSCYLLAQDICRKMIVSDISAASLGRAEKLIAKHGLQDRACFIVRDGLLAVDRPVQAAVISGMGGTSIARMLKEAHRLGDARLIVSAHTQLPKLRQAISESGYRVLQEIVVRASGRFYTVMTAQRGESHYSQRELYIGISLTGSDSAKVSDYLSWRLRVALEAKQRQHSPYLDWLGEEIESARRKESDHL